MKFWVVMFRHLYYKGRNKDGSVTFVTAIEDAKLWWEDDPVESTAIADKIGGRAIGFVATPCNGRGA